MWEIAGLALPQAYVVITSVFIARYLGPSGVGRVVLISYVQLTVGTLLTLGMPTALLRFTGRLVGAGKGAEVQVLARRVWVLEFVGAAVGLLVLLGAAASGASPRAAWVFAGITAATAIMHGVPSSLLRGLQHWRAARIMGITSGAVSVVLKVISLALGRGISILFAIDAALAIVTLLGTMVFAQRATRVLPAPVRHTDSFRPLLKFAGIASINIIIGLVVYQRTEVFLLAHFSTDSEIAIYSIPFAMVSALLLLSQAVGSALAPAVATLWGAHQLDRIRSGFSRAIRLVLDLNIVITAFAVALGPVTIRLVYGADFAGAERVFRILVITLPAWPLAALSSAVLLGINRQWGLTFIGGIAAVANIGLAFALIPPYGAVGAAIANSLAQLIGSIPLFFYATRIIGHVELHPAALGRIVAAGTCAVAATLLVVHELPPATGLIAGSAVFVVTLLLASIALRPIAAEDGGWLVELAGLRAHGWMRVAAVSLSRAIVERKPPRNGATGSP